MERITQEDIVQVLINKRKALKLSQKDVANFLGSTNQSIMNYEKGHSDIPLKKFIKWCELLNLKFYLD